MFTLSKVLLRGFARFVTSSTDLATDIFDCLNKKSHSCSNRFYSLGVIEIVEIEKLIALIKRYHFNDELEFGRQA